VQLHSSIQTEIMGTYEKQQIIFHKFIYHYLFNDDYFSVDIFNCGSSDKHLIYEAIN
jgi:hypothetical protein